METSTFLGMENRVLMTASETEGAVGVIDVSVQPGAGLSRRLPAGEGRHQGDLGPLV
jgi:hypothetical protein